MQAYFILDPCIFLFSWWYKFYVRNLNTSVPKFFLNHSNSKFGYTKQVTRMPQCLHLHKLKGFFNTIYNFLSIQNNLYRSKIWSKYDTILFASESTIIHGKNPPFCNLASKLRFLYFSIAKFCTILNHNKEILSTSGYELAF